MCTGKEMGKKPIGYQARLRQLHQGGVYLQVAPAWKGTELQALCALQDEMHGGWGSPERDEGPGGDGRGCRSIAVRGGRAFIPGVGVGGQCQCEDRDGGVADPWRCDHRADGGPTGSVVSHARSGMHRGEAVRSDGATVDLPQPAPELAEGAA